jgi:hypothetical protein
MGSAANFLLPDNGAMDYQTGRADLLTERTTLLDVWERNPPSIPGHRYPWIYGPDSPAGAASWLLRHRDAVVGSVGLTTRMFRRAGQRVAAGQSIDLVIDRSYRSVGPAIMLQRAVTAFLDEQNLSFVYAFPTEKSDLVLKRVGYASLGSMERWTRVLNAEDKLRPHLRLGWATKAAARVVEGGMWATSREVFYRRPADVRTELRDNFDDRFDELWAANEGRAETVGVRTAEYLNWRFGRAPHAKYHVFCVERPHGRLLGYVVYCESDRSFAIADLLTDNVNALDTLIPEFLRHARSAGAFSVSMTYLGWETLGQRLGRYGFWRRPEDSPILIFPGAHRSESERAQMLDCRSWYLTEADRDV